MANEAIGRADYDLGVDKTRLTQGLKEADNQVKASGKSAEDAYAASGGKAGDRFSAGLKDSIKRGAAGAFAAVSGLATKGLLELEDAEASFRAETGATEAQAKAAGKAINEMSGRNLFGLKEIGTTLEKVTRDIGETGDEADALTERFLKFGRATKQGPAEAVADFDDILDAWGLTGKDAAGIMDQIVASGQRFGGTAAGMAKALAALAPTLKAANMNLDDGVGLLNLFQSAGLDAAAAPVALQHALSQVKSPEELKRLLADIIATEDPFERAQKAADLFGSKAGAKMANALRPGMDSLDSFTIKAGDVVDATTEASDAMDSSFGAQAQLKLKAFGAALISVGGNFGPLLTGLSSLVSLGAALKVDDLIKHIAGPLANGLKVAGTRGGRALLDGIESIASSAAGSSVGQALGAKFGVMFAGATKLGETLTTLFLKLPGVASVRSALLAGAIQLGTIQGTAMGSAASKAFGIGLVVGLAAIAPELQKQADSLARQVHDTVFGEKGPLDDVGAWLDSLPWPIGPVGAPDWAKLGSDAADGEIEGYKDRMADEGGTEWGPWTTPPTSDAFASGQAVGAANANGVKAASSDMTAAWQAALLDPQQAALERARAKAYSAGGKLVDRTADGMRAHRNEVDAAWEQLLSDLKTFKGREDVKAVGRLVSKELATALKSGDSLIHQSGEDTKEVYLERLRELVQRNGGIGKKAMDELNKAMHDKNPEVRETAREAKEIVEKHIKPKTKPVGDQAMDDLGAGLKNGTGTVGQIAWRVGDIIAGNLLGGLRSGLGIGGGSGGSKSGGNAGGSIKRALGGPTRRGDLVEIGERGPEWYKEGGSGYVTPKDVGESSIGDYARSLVDRAVATLMPQAPTLARSTVIGALHVAVTLDAGSPSGWGPRDIAEISRRIGDQVRLAISSGDD